jgi:hypothetical protein
MAIDAGKPSGVRRSTQFGKACIEFLAGAGLACLLYSAATREGRWPRWCAAR